MRHLMTCMLILAGSWSCWAEDALQLLPDKELPGVFAGGNRVIHTVWRNYGDQMVDVEMRARLLQTSSSTVAGFDEKAWKRIKILPGQTVMESAQLNFPSVRAGTKFIIQWIENTNVVVGRTEVMVYPDNLLGELKDLAGGYPVGLLDPQNVLKPLFKNSKVDFTELQSFNLADFSGRLAVLGPFASKTQMPEDLVRQIQVLTKRGTAIVWLQPPDTGGDALHPSFYSVPQRTNAVIVVQPDMISDLAQSPLAQIHLVHFCRLALNPLPPALPGLTPASEP